MIKTIRVSIFLFIVLLCISCSSLPQIPLPWASNSVSWHIPPVEEIAGTVWISGIEVDKAGSRNSIENEASCLLPLLLLDRNYLVLEEMENADFIADVKIREREFIKGWKTVCSIGVEIYFHHGKNRNGVSVPLAAAHTVRESNGGLSSSKNLRSLLESAVKEAVAALERNQHIPPQGSANENA